MPRKRVLCCGISNVEYAEGYDAGLFAATHEIMPVVVPRYALDITGLDLGESATLVRKTNRGIRPLSCVIAGVYDGHAAVSGGGTGIIVPLADFKTYAQPAYIVAQFDFEPSKNRDLVAAHNSLQTSVSDADSSVPVRLVIWDEELRLSIAPLEQNLSLMTVLYPVTTGASSLIAAGLALLLLLSNAREAAIIRVLGTTGRKTRLAFAGEQVLLCLAGLLIGCSAALLRFGSVNLAATGLYMGCCLSAALYGAKLITRRKPLELLQVKE